MSLTYLFDLADWRAPDSRPRRRLANGNARAGLSNDRPSPSVQTSLDSSESSSLEWNLLRPTLAEFAEFTPRRQDLDEHFASRSSRNGKLRLTAAAWELACRGNAIADCRFVEIRGNGTEIVNCWVFPHAPEQLPIFASELLVFRKQVRLVFIDLQGPRLSPETKARFAPFTSELEPLTSLLPDSGVPPEWAWEESLGPYVFSRPNDNRYLDLIREIYLSYLFTWGRIATAVSPLDPSQRSSTESDLNAYKTHHMNSSPGKKFLGNLFGHEWTEQFLTQFLYG